MMEKEIRLRAAEFNAQPLETIYFGGGTPSLLTEGELMGLFQAIEEASLDFKVAKPQLKSNATEYPHLRQAEITFEANPDDLTTDKVALLANSPVNRLSIGLQSFNEADLRFMNRAHSAKESTEAMQRVLKAGFTDISVDLIYGSPSTSDAIWNDNISRVLDFGVPHVSAYALTVEPQTALAHRVKTGQVTAPTDERFARQYDRLIERLTLAGYEHYEISNFALPARYSRHNTAYWQGKPYVGIGPAAHGFNGLDQRRWNVANNGIYTRELEKINSPADFATATGLFETEHLSLAERYNEFIMTGLRTQWGVALQDLTDRFGNSFREYFQTSLAPLLEPGYFEVSALNNNRYVLTPAGRHRADGIAAEAFWVVE